MDVRGQVGRLPNPCPNSTLSDSIFRTQRSNISYLYLVFKTLMLMTRELVRVVGTRGARTTGQVSQSLRRMLRSPGATRRRQPVRSRTPERQLLQIDAADGGSLAVERCGLLPATAAFHLAF